MIQIESSQRLGAFYPRKHSLIIFCGAPGGADVEVRMNLEPGRSFCFWRNHGSHFLWISWFLPLCTTCKNPPVVTIFQTSWYSPPLQDDFAVHPIKMGSHQLSAVLRTVLWVIKTEQPEHVKSWGKIIPLTGDINEKGRAGDQLSKKCGGQGQECH